MAMSSWTKPHAEQGHRRVGQHWTRPSSTASYNRKPPLPLETWRPAVPRWERMFCNKVGSIPWRKLVETKKYLFLHENVMKWDDSAGKEAFENAKKRFWASINGLPCDISLPDPNMYIDDVNWDSGVDPELILDLEKDTIGSNVGEKDEEVVILGSSLLLNPSFSCTGWGEAEAAGEPSKIIPTRCGEAEVASEAAKITDLIPNAQVNLHENNMIGSLQQNRAPSSPTYQHEGKSFMNDSWGWNRRENYHIQRMGRGGGWNRDIWYGYSRTEGGLSWYKVPEYYPGDEYHRGGGRGNYQGRRRGSFSYDRARPSNIPNAW